MARILTDRGSIVEQPLCGEHECPTKAPGQFQRKPPQSVYECIELCSSFLAERGCLTLHRQATPEENAA